MPLLLAPRITDGSEGGVGLASREPQEECTVKESFTTRVIFVIGSGRLN